jgi:hypothetical protein
MTEREWDRAVYPVAGLHYFASRRPLPSQRKLRLFACACVRRVWHLLDDDRSRRAVEAAELYADDQVTLRKLAGACRAARQVDGAAGSAAAAAAALNLHQLVSRDQGPQLTHVVAAAAEASQAGGSSSGKLRRQQKAQAELLRDIFGNPFRPVTFSPDWRTDTAVALARTMYESRDFSAMPILADALQDAGCDNADVLDHCRGPGPHVRGCWVVDLVLGWE